MASFYIKVIVTSAYTYISLPILTNNSQFYPLDYLHNLLEAKAKLITPASLFMANSAVLF